MKLNKSEITNVANKVSTFGEIAAHAVAISRILNRGGDKEVNKILEKTHIGVVAVTLTSMAVGAICKR